MRVQGLSDATIRRRLVCINKFFSYMWSMGDFLHDCPKVELPIIRRRTRLPEILTLKSIQRLLLASRKSTRNAKTQSAATQLRSWRNYLMMELLCSTGMRCGELVGLDLENVDTNRRTLLIEGKGRKQRIVFLASEEVIDALRIYNVLRTAVGCPERALFLNNTHSRLTTQTVQDVVRSLCKSVGIGGRITPHSIRHSVATLLLEHGADIKAVQDILGHSHISTTTIYLHLSTPYMADVMRRFGPRSQFKLKRHGGRM
jgi:integrase/recombinase XerD